MIMKLFANYTFLQTKRVLKSFLLLLGVLCAAALTTALVLWCVNSVFKSEEMSLVKIGLVIPEEETASKYVTDMISETESVKSICSFEYCSYEEAADRFEKGLYEAVVVLPSGFYHDVQVGINPPAVIYIKDNPTLAGKLFKELLTDAASYIGIAEAGVYSVLSMDEEYTPLIERNEIGNTVALRYANRIFKRDGLFRETHVFAGGIEDSETYMICSGLIIVLLYMGICFNRMYGRENKPVMEKLRVNGMGILPCAVSKVLVMTVYIFIPGTIMALTAFRGTCSGKLCAVMGLVSLTMAVYFEVVYELTGDGKKGIFVLIIINSIGIVCSGMVIPTAYLQKYAGQIGRVFPFRYWLELLLKTCGGGVR